MKRILPAAARCCATSDRADIRVGREQAAHTQPQQQHAHRRQEQYGRMGMLLLWLGVRGLFAPDADIGPV
ncbi:MAG: hypothetical protein EOO54_18805 [Haliea sp.]|nr:MAG: hypothetical protein EOO54_18805 [Haliea sp.]